MESCGCLATRARNLIENEHLSNAATRMLFLYLAGPHGHSHPTAAGHLQSTLALERTPQLPMAAE